MKRSGGAVLPSGLHETYDEVLTAMRKVRTGHLVSALACGLEGYAADLMICTSPSHIAL